MAKSLYELMREEHQLICCIREMEEKLEMESNETIPSELEDLYHRLIDTHDEMGRHIAFITT